MYEVRKFLVDSTHNVRGDVTFSSGQTVLFNRVAQKMTLLDNFNNKVVSAPSGPAATPATAPVAETTTTPAPVVAEKTGPKRRTKQ